LSSILIPPLKGRYHAASAKQLNYVRRTKMVSLLRRHYRK
jgi:hypothetical protein